MIEVSRVTKRYGDALAVDDLSFTVEPGVVTGFLGPNGAGKSTTMRMMVGLDAPTSGRVTIDGVAYGELRYPLRRVGALLEARSIHPGRSARNHLRWLAESNGIDVARVDEVLEMVGLSTVARKRAGGFSLGMGQRLGIAAAMLGNPDVLLLDEPVNGLDPEGILWIRNLLRHFANEGRTVFVSSHLMSEMAQTADRLIVIGKGRLIADATVDEVIRQSSGNRVRVVSPDAAALRARLEARGATVEVEDGETLNVRGLAAREIGIEAGQGGHTLYELTPVTASLEQAFMELTHDTAEYHGSTRQEVPA